MLVAARPGYMKPVLLARMISAMDQLSGGRVADNLIAGQSDAEAMQDGIDQPKEERYELMDEEVSIIKALWTTPGEVQPEDRDIAVSRRAGAAGWGGRLGVLTAWGAGSQTVTAAPMAPTPAGLLPR